MTAMATQQQIAETCVIVKTQTALDVIFLVPNASQKNVGLVVDVTEDGVMIMLTSTMKELECGSIAELFYGMQVALRLVSYIVTSQEKMPIFQQGSIKTSNGQSIKSKTDSLKFATSN